ncbi:hypothetical protein D477_014633 [Arthrobacter crystallopoietes BAB-32]|uniref:Uncharacterized protein n=1 Tax=Arthrobacter crystallopoietes BAB-32 TaxID=1246476 RepID=N1V086_9MICC|nr:hypothetical protein [Arthrobacter crystallopoietes]EMY33492.1 hypothetical protein D477_014633 [Arthrobacter crystallopoietes BAB-32]
MTTAVPGRVRTARAIAGVLSPGVVWGVALVLGALAGSWDLLSAAWGIGAAVLICLVPWTIVARLDRAGQLRRGIRRFGLAPLAVCAGVLMYGSLRAIQWLDGPLALAAVIFAACAGLAAVVLLDRVVRLGWAAVSYGALAVILPLMLGLPGLVAWAAAALGTWAQAVLGRTTAARLAVSLAAGALVCGGTYALLLQAVR